VIRSGLRKLRPDVVALQETVWGNGYEQASDLLGPDYEMARHASRSADGVGAVLASRWPFGTIREVDLHVTERVDDLPWAAAVTAEALLPEPFGLTLFAHHKPTYQVGYARERELQAAASARFVETQVAGRDLHVVLLGDLDDTPLGRRIDYVLVRCGIRGPSLQIVNCHRIFDQAVDGLWASDHFEVFADLQVPA
jgi:endonuclease/exonuclease/phosphatase family metal-dependent hydrolase